MACSYVCNTVWFRMTALRRVWTKSIYHTQVKAYRRGVDRSWSASSKRTDNRRQRHADCRRSDGPPTAHSWARAWSSVVAVAPDPTRPPCCPDTGARRSLPVPRYAAGRQVATELGCRPASLDTRPRRRRRWCSRRTSPMSSFPFPLQRSRAGNISKHSTALLRRAKNTNYQFAQSCHLHTLA